MTLQISETAVPSVASAIAFLNRMPVDARDLVLAACSKAGGDVASPMPMSFDAAHPPAGWRSIGDVPPVSVLAPIFASPAWAKRFERGTELQAYSATCSGLKSLDRPRPKDHQVRQLRRRAGREAPAGSRLAAVRCGSP